MVRQKKGTPEGKRAAEKWHDTMLKKLGSEEAIIEHLRTIGRKGGKVSCDGGFASFVVGSDGLTGRQRARVAGAKGGRAPRKTKKRIKEDEFIESILES